MPASRPPPSLHFFAPQSLSPIPPSLQVCLQVMLRSSLQLMRPTRRCAILHTRRIEGRAAGGHVAGGQQPPSLALSLLRPEHPARASHIGLASDVERALGEFDRVQPKLLPKTGIEAELSGKVGRAPLRKSSYFTRPWEGGEVECEGAAPQKTIAGAVLEAHVASFSRNSLEGDSQIKAVQRAPINA